MTIKDSAVLTGRITVSSEVVKQLIVEKLRASTPSIGIDDTSLIQIDYEPANIGYEVRLNESRANRLRGETVRNLEDMGLRQPQRDDTADRLEEGVQNARQILEEQGASAAAAAIVAGEL